MSPSEIAATIVLAVFFTACAVEGQTVSQPPAGTDLTADCGAGSDLAATDRSGQDDSRVGDLVPPLDGPQTEASGADAGQDGLPSDVSSSSEMTQNDAENDALATCPGEPPCNDGDPCTVDACDAGQCSHFLLPPFACCQADTECADTIACTEDLCLSHTCYNIPESNLCCANPGDCDDLEPCTLDQCVGNTCAHIFMTSQDCQCSNWLDCDDGLVCTQGTCKGGGCIYELAPAASGCCATALDCNDGTQDTVDACVQFMCDHTYPTPCIDDSDCDDGDPCTQDTCDLGPPCTGDTCDGPCVGPDCIVLSGTCVRVPVEGCCLVDGQCDDGLPGTVDRCLGNHCFHLLEPWPEACATVEACDDENPCTLEQCLDGFCTYALAPGTDCCSTPQACDDNDACTKDDCGSFQCQHFPIPGPVEKIQWAFPQPVLPAGFSVKTDGSNVKWQVSGKRSVSAPYSLYFGDLAGPTIDNGKAVKGEVITDWVDLPADSPVWLHFWLFMAVEPLYSVDQLTVHVDDGTSLLQVFDKSVIGGSTGGAWKQVPVDLGKFSGKKARLVVRFDSVDATNNAYEGVYVDDINWSWNCDAW